MWPICVHYVFNCDSLGKLTHMTSWEDLAETIASLRKMRKSPRLCLIELMSRNQWIALTAAIRSRASERPSDRASEWGVLWGWGEVEVEVRLRWGWGWGEVEVRWGWGWSLRSQCLPRSRCSVCWSDFDRRFEYSIRKIRVFGNFVFRKTISHLISRNQNLKISMDSWSLVAYSRRKKKLDQKWHF